MSDPWSDPDFFLDERENNPCEHSTARADDDGLGRRFYVCVECRKEVVLSEPDEDGQSYWEAIP